MLNGIVLSILAAAVLLAAVTGSMEALTNAIVGSAKDAAWLALSLTGVMAFFLGLMRVGSDAGLLGLLGRALGPVLVRLFPSVPANHPAMSAMILNVGSNLLGLGNAATPFGIKAMQELDRLNPVKGTATDAMVVFLAINTSGLALLPSATIGLRLAAGSQNPTGILVTTWFAGGCATLVAVTAALVLARLPRFRATSPGAGEVAPAGPKASVEASDPPEVPRAVPWRSSLAAAFWIALVGALGWRVARLAGSTSIVELVRGELSFWILPALVAGMVLFGWSRSVRVYESMVEGAKEGFHVAVRIIPYLVVILVAAGMFRASGGIELLQRGLGPWTESVGMPAEAIPMALIRPLSGSAAMGVMTEIMKTSGPDSLVGYLVSTISGCTETTFYVLALYFGAVGTKRTRHALPACLLADLAGISASVFIVNLLYG
jgi:spore maturation protein SpmA